MKSERLSANRKRKVKGYSTSERVWVDLKTLRTRTEPKEGYQKFDSQLEFSVYCYLMGLGVNVIPQFSFELLPKVGCSEALEYTPDFYLPDEGIVIEVKGEWITQPKCKAQKEVFLIKWNLLQRRRLLCFVVGEKAFKLSSNLQVMDFRDFTI